jgi:aromatic ring-cleaving dioxygenase
MREFTLRPFGEADGAQLLRWHKDDVQGLQSLFGPQTELTHDHECIAAFNDVFDAVQRGHALFWMVDHGQDPVGFFALTHIPADRSTAMAHIYIDPAQRRYSLKAAQAIDETLNATMAQLGMSRVFAAMTGGKGALHVAKRLGFVEPESVLLTKVLGQNGS